ncbi:hypothetical protein D3C76_222170 [compost metagenome]
MNHIDDYELFDKDFERFVQLGRESLDFDEKEICECPQPKELQATKANLGSSG